MFLIDFVRKKIFNFEKQKTKTQIVFWRFGRIGRSISNGIAFAT